MCRSHLNKFLAVDQFGNVTCENDEKGKGLFNIKNLFLTLESKMKHKFIIRQLCIFYM